MNIIHMIDDFQILCEELDELGPFEAYKRYISKYPELFKGILEGLYMTGVESLKPMIEAIDFKRRLLRTIMGLLRYKGLYQYLKK